MNVQQLVKQIRYLLLNRTWGGTGSRVFARGSVHASAALPEQAKANMRLPAALTYSPDATSDPEFGEEPDHIQSSVIVTTISGAIPGDAMGEKAMIGGNIADRTKSEGRGVLELETEVKAAIGRLLPDNGVVISYATSSIGRPTLDDVLGYIVYRDIIFKAFVTQDPSYPAPINIVATGGSGQVALTWTNPPDRYDRFRVVLRRATGATAPSSVSAGTGVTLSANLASSVTDSGLSAGTYSYALFAQYDERYDAAMGETLQQADQTSAAITRTSVTVS